jgi:hypothetical protein
MHSSGSADCRKHRNEFSGSIKCEEFLDQFSLSRPPLPHGVSYGEFSILHRVTHIYSHEAINFKTLMKGQ